LVRFTAVNKANPKLVVKELKLSVSKVCTLSPTSRCRVGVAGGQLQCGSDNEEGWGRGLVFNLAMQHWCEMVLSSMADILSHPTDLP
jgi:hypothetical protein